MRRLLAQRYKLLAYAAGVAAAAISAGLLHGSALQLALAIEAVATGFGIHQVTNAP